MPNLSSQREAFPASVKTTLLYVIIPPHPSEDQYGLEKVDDGLIQSESVFLMKKPFHTKSEVISSRTINFLTKSFLVVLLCAAFIAMIMVMLLLTVWGVRYESEDFEFDEELLPGGSTWNAVTFVSYPSWMTTASLTVGSIYFLYSILTLAVFIYSVFKMKCRILREQGWIIVFLVAVVFFLIPIEPVFAVLVVDFTDEGFEALSTASVILENIRVAACYTALFFFPWALMHSYRLLEPNRWKFYRAKLGTLAVYVAWLIICATVFKVNIALLPFTTLVFCVRIYVNVPHARFLVVGIVTAAIEMATLVLMTMSMLKTEAKLRDTSYVQYRTRHVGFALFRWISTRFFVLLITSGLLVALCQPIGGYRSSLIAGHDDDLAYWYPLRVATVDTFLLAWMTITAYLMLPSTTSVPTRAKPGYGAIPRDEQPIAYKTTGDKENDFNCFVMDTQVLAFNFAWLAYYAGSEKINTVDLNECEILGLVCDGSRDIQAMVGKTATRLVVAFRGTKTLRNVKLDVKISWSMVGNVFKVLEDSTTHNCKRAKVHSGFSKAYKGISSELKSKLLASGDTKSLPILVTGHSLGGALATLFAFDLVLDDPDVGKRLSVTTFGSPKVGNKYFRKMYDDRVRSHWRVELAPDMITRLPLAPYVHVGKQALITESNDLLLDPSHLDVHINQQKRALLRSHKKSSYLIALKSWCEKQHGDLYMPTFLAFPVKDGSSKGLFQLSEDRASMEFLGKSERASTSSRRSSSSSVRDSPVPEHVSILWRRLAESVALRLEAEANA
ncbi:hypothetical protein NDN08_006028 [Rhodosorus marinus]|uniref:Fungal lipase-type domain-containing protein n=1 Tax=Rhodosorus marinus TaxID=101924 RepID=A0AAV8UNP4_9RHOD|nr:hypothetical protein NDN08_006028 [Rhodosorus marinus]